MDEAATATVLIVRGAGASGRRLSHDMKAAGHRPVVMDERTCAHEGVPGVRVSFDETSKVRRAVSDVLQRYEGLDAVVFLPSPAWAAGASVGHSWELHLAREFATVAAVVREAAASLALRSGVVVHVSEPISHDAPSQPSALLGAICEPAIEALADEFGFRVARVVTDASGTARGSIVATRLLAALTPPLARVEASAGRA